MKKFHQVVFLIVFFLFFNSAFANISWYDVKIANKLNEEWEANSASGSIQIKFNVTVSEPIIYDDYLNWTNNDINNSGAILNTDDSFWNLWNDWNIELESPKWNSFYSHQLAARYVLQHIGYKNTNPYFNYHSDNNYLKNFSLQALWAWAIAGIKIIGIYID